jgi:DNA-binding transcriptional regulator YiaG
LLVAMVVLIFNDCIKTKEAQGMLNENIRNLRKSKGLSQEELAIRLNVVRQTISKWEKGVSQTKGY